MLKHTTTKHDKVLVTLFNFSVNEYECICDPGWGGFACDENLGWF